VKQNINLVEVHPQLSNNGHPVDGASITNHHVMKNYNRPGTFSESNLKVTPEAMGFTGIKGLCRHSPVWAISSKARGQGLYHCVKTLGLK